MAEAGSKSGIAAVRRRLWFMAASDPNADDPEAFAEWLLLSEAAVYLLLKRPPLQLKSASSQPRWETFSLSLGAHGCCVRLVLNAACLRLRSA